MKLFTHIEPFNADLFTPVELYLSLRDQHRKVCLMESNDYHSRQDSKSFIGMDPLVEIQLNDRTLTIDYGDKINTHQLDESKSIADQIQRILDKFQFEDQTFNGFFGRINFELNTYDETHIKARKESNIPDLHLFIFETLIVIDHFTNDGFLIQNGLSKGPNIRSLKDILSSSKGTELPFELVGDESAMFSDEEFSKHVQKGIQHCEAGDVFQLVLSNAFAQPYFGDDFQVYRTLRRLNPSPYLFYFDFETYRLFGSSPEAQLVIKNGKAEIHPIAGTVPKTGNQDEDEKHLKFLVGDEKENAEHTMLVDLARNDLSRDCEKVYVERYKEVQHFSHVIHLVSKVTGDIQGSNGFETLCHSFPAGTLSGTPKPRALELINEYEPQSRDFYGGAIGKIGPGANVNTAIVIRSVLSMNGALHYRAGAGIVLDSDPLSETREVHHKLRAVRTAIQRTAEEFQPLEQTV